LYFRCLIILLTYLLIVLLIDSNKSFIQTNDTVQTNTTTEDASKKRKHHQVQEPLQHEDNSLVSMNSSLLISNDVSINKQMNSSTFATLKVKLNGCCFSEQWEVDLYCLIMVQSNETFHTSYRNNKEGVLQELNTLHKYEILDEQTKSRLIAINHLKKKVNVSLCVYCGC